MVASYFSLIASDLFRAEDAPAARVISGATREALELLRDLTMQLRGASGHASGAASVDYLRLFAVVSLGWMWVRMAIAGAAEQSTFHDAKLAVADFFGQRVLPKARGLAAIISAGEGTIMALASEAF